MILSDVFERVKQNVSIEQVISYYLPKTELRRAGKNLVGLCPFHQERTPSFTVDREKNVFHCFGCGVGGDTVKLVSLALNLRPLEAARQICRDFGLPVDRPATPEAKREAKKAARRHKAKADLDLMVHMVHEELSAWYRAINRVLALGWPAYIEFAEYAHLLPVIEYWLDILDHGTAEEKIEVLKQCS
ncbi:MAG: hypothetical protein K6U04_15745 [Armatimonadetes bacterium]|nr:hypothetical protein [Armatimonadota bacterium]